MDQRGGLPISHLPARLRKTAIKRSGAPLNAESDHIDARGRSPSIDYDLPTDADLSASGSNESGFLLPVQRPVEERRSSLRRAPGSAPGLLVRLDQELSPAEQGRLFPGLHRGCPPQGTRAAAAGSAPEGNMTIGAGSGSDRSHSASTSN